MKRSQTVSGATGRGRQLILGGAGVGTQVGLEVELNSREEGLLLTYVLVRGMHAVTERTSLNWLFGISWMVLVLSSCIWGCSESISEEVIAWLLDVNLPGLKLVSQGCGQFQKLMSSLRRCSVGEIVDSRRGLTETLFGFGGPDILLSSGELFQG